MGVFELPELATDAYLDSNKQPRHSEQHTEPFRDTGNRPRTVNGRLDVGAFEVPEQTGR